MVGAGASAYHDDFYGSGVMEGGAFWVNYYPRVGPDLLRGFGLALEGRDISMNPTSTQPSNLREDTASGGAVYSYSSSRLYRFRPYVEFMWGHASIDFHVGVPHYNHDTRSYRSGAGGFEYRAWRNVWLRGEYEEQFWQRMFENPANYTHSGIKMRPRGASLGVSYSFFNGHHMHTK
jgi:hypothetical protein